MLDNEYLYVNEIFESVSGEMGVFPQGTWVTILRLQGCNLRCSWCDAEKSQDTANGAKVTLSVVMDTILQFKNNYLLITGGEPLEQPRVLALIEYLRDFSMLIQVETNGTYFIPAIKHTHWVIDQKCPSSGMSGAMLPVPAMAANLKGVAVQLSRVCLKFVVADEMDVEHALDTIEEYIAYDFPGPFAISPVDAIGCGIEAIVRQIKQRDPELLNRIVFSVQIHKLCNMR